VVESSGFSLGEDNNLPRVSSEALEHDSNNDTSDKFRVHNGQLLQCARQRCPAPISQQWGCRAVAAPDAGVTALSDLGTGPRSSGRPA